jgi:type IX secretion system PorP/SprF family membrane protein
MRTLLITLTIVISQLSTLFAQGGVDPVYSQFFSNALYLNPALAGSHICPRLKLIRRAQWPGIPISYISNYLSYDQYHFGMEAGFGFSMAYDNLANGMLTNFSFSAAYSKKVNINKQWSFIGGLQGGWGINQLNWDKLNFADQLDYELGFVLPTSVPKPSYTSKQILDVNAGMVFEYRDQLYIGITGHHLTKPQIGFIPADESKLNRKFSAYISYVIPLQGLNNSNLGNTYEPSLSPSILYQRQGNFNNLLGGVYFAWYPFIGGLWFRHAVFNSDAIILLIGFEQKNFKIHYSFDYTFSRLTFGSSFGAHEVSFTWQFACPDYMKKRIKPIKCPSILK